MACGWSALFFLLLSKGPHPAGHLIQSERSRKKEESLALCKTLNFLQGPVLCVIDNLFSVVMYVFVSRRSCVECYLKVKESSQECALKCNSLHATVSNSSGQNSLLFPVISGHMVRMAVAEKHVFVLSLYFGMQCNSLVNNMSHLKVWLIKFTQPHVGLNLFELVHKMFRNYFHSSVLIQAIFVFHARRVFRGTIL